MIPAFCLYMGILIPFSLYSYFLAQTLFYGYSNIFLLIALSFWYNADQDEWEQDFY